MKTRHNPKEHPLSDNFGAVRKLLINPDGILNSIMESMGDGLSIQDRNMRVVYQNKFMIDNFSYHVGDYCYHIYEKRSNPCEGCPILEAFRTEQTCKSLRVGIRKDGQSFRFENIASVLRNEKGDIVAGIELCRNVEDRERAIDEQKEAMDRLGQTQSQLVRAEKLATIGQLVAGVAHEINNPAAYVLSNLSTMRKYIDAFFHYIESMEQIITRPPKGNSLEYETLNEIMQVINKEEYSYLKNDLPAIIDESLNGIQRIKAIVSSLLDFSLSRDEEKQEISINTVLESAILLLGKEINTKNIVFTKNFSNLPVFLGNLSQLQQMFLNLIMNACQAIIADGQICIKTTVEDKYICIAISDTGVGIPEDTIKNIFNPFFTTHEVGKGIGLGLSIAYRILENHNGNIDVNSRLGFGTTFTVRLPIELGKV